MRRLTRLIALFGVAGSVVVGATGAAFARRAVRPFGVLEAAVADITGGDLRRRVEGVRGGEAEVLATRFNAMVVALEDQDRALRDRAAALQAANAELDAFAYSVSHDLRAPLRAIDGFSRILEEDYAGVLDDEGTSHLARVRAATQRMAALIDDLLQLSRIGRAELTRLPVDLSALAARVVAERRAADTDRDVAVSIAPGLHVEADPRLVEVVLRNLVDNAWKFTSKTTGARIFIGSAAPGVFHVRDNGAGFDMAYASKLFGAFQRLHADPDFPGTGIGLATVLRVVRRHGGWIRADAEVDRGATFVFALDPDVPPDDAAVGHALTSDAASVTDEGSAQ